MSVTYLQLAIVSIADYNKICVNTIRHTIFVNVRSKADMSQHNLPHGTEPTTKKCKTEKLRSKNGYAQK